MHFPRGSSDNERVPDTRCNPNFPCRVIERLGMSKSDSPQGGKLISWLDSSGKAMSMECASRKTRHS